MDFLGSHYKTKKFPYRNQQEGFCSFHLRLMSLHQIKHYSQVYVITFYVNSRLQYHPCNILRFCIDVHKKLWPWHVDTWRQHFLIERASLYSSVPPVVFRKMCGFCLCDTFLSGCNLKADPWKISFQNHKYCWLWHLRLEEENCFLRIQYWLTSRDVVLHVNLQAINF